MTSINDIAPFRSGEMLSAEKLEAIRRAILAGTSGNVSRGVRSNSGITFDNRERESVVNIPFRNNTGSVVPGFSIFTLDKATDLDSGQASEPYLDVEVDSAGLTYYTNEHMPAPQGSCFYGRNISTVYPAKIRFTGTPPLLGEECGPANDGTGTIKADGQGFVCIQTPDTNNMLVWVQALGGASSSLRVGELVSNVAPLHTEYVDLYQQTQVSTTPEGPIAGPFPLPGEQVLCLNITDFTLYSGPLMYVQIIENFVMPIVFPAQIEECGFTNTGTTTVP